MDKVKGEQMTTETKAKRVSKTAAKAPSKTAGSKTAPSKTAGSKTAASKTTSKTASKTTSKTASKTGVNNVSESESVKLETTGTKSMEDAEHTKTSKSTKNTKSTKTSVPVLTETKNIVVEKSSFGVSDKLTDNLSSFMTRLSDVSALMSSLKTEFRNLNKLAMREFKQANKVSSKRKNKSGTRAPSGFVKPTKISNELAEFLGKDLGSEMARTEVTREINSYIRANKLQDKSNGRKINADDKLSTLLKLSNTDELTYFNLQRYMSPHFAKSVKSVVKEEPVVAHEGVTFTY